MQDIMSVIILRSSVRSQGRSNDKYFSSTSTSSTCFQSDISLTAIPVPETWEEEEANLYRSVPGQPWPQAVSSTVINLLSGKYCDGQKSDIIRTQPSSLSPITPAVCPQWCSLYSHKFRLIKLMLDLYLSLFLAVPDTVLRQLSWIERDKPCKSE